MKYNFTKLSTKILLIIYPLIAVVKKKSFLISLYHSFKKICKILGREFHLFKEIEKRFNEIEKTFRLLEYIREWLPKNEFRFTVINNINYPTIETIKALHDFLVVKYERDIDKIHEGEYSLAALKFEGIKYWMKNHLDQEEDIILRGAHLFNKFLEEGHPFVDGNKRTGWATLWIYLAANGYFFFFPMYFRESEQVKKIEQWAHLKEESKNIDEIVEWIKIYTRKK